MTRTMAIDRQFVPRPIRLFENRHACPRWLVAVVPLVNDVLEPLVVGFWNGRTGYMGARFGTLFQPVKVKATLPFKVTPVRLPKRYRRL